MLPPCPNCATPLASSLFCEACRRLLPAPARSEPFEAFGLAPRQRLDAAALRKRLLQLTRAMHPDFFGGASAEQRELALRNTAELNGAYELLADDAARASFLVASLGGPDEQREREMPRAFLLEVLEWNEALEAARASRPASPERAALAGLASALEAERAAQMNTVERLLEPLPPARSAALVEVRRALNAVRYVDRALGEIRELQTGLPQPA